MCYILCDMLYDIVRLVYVLYVVINYFMMYYINYFMLDLFIFDYINKLIYDIINYFMNTIYDILTSKHNHDSLTLLINESFY